jgi:hypothetical protein
MILISNQKVKIKISGIIKEKDFIEDTSSKSGMIKDVIKKKILNALININKVMLCMSN